MKPLKKVLPPLLFLLLGTLLFAFVYKHTGVRQLSESLSALHPCWLLMTVPLTIAAVVIRALRWRLLLRPLGYHGGVWPLILGVFQLYLANLFVPRSGELLRCGIVTRYSGIPFVTIAGTVAAERASDLAAFIVIFAGTLIWQRSFFLHLFTRLPVGINIPYLIPCIIVVICIIAVVAVLRFRQLRNSIRAVAQRFSDGFASLLKTGAPVRFIMYTFAIQCIWTATLPLLFHAFDPTAHLTCKHALLLYISGTFAVLIPVQAGIGVWHGFATATLLMFGIDDQNSRLFALFTHSFTCTVNIVLGIMGYLLLPTVNLRKNDARHLKSPTE